MKKSFAPIITGVVVIALSLCLFIGGFFEMIAPSLVKIQEQVLSGLVSNAGSGEGLNFDVNGETKTLSSDQILAGIKYSTYLPSWYKSMSMIVGVTTFICSILFFVIGILFILRKKASLRLFKFVCSFLIIRAVIICLIYALSQSAFILTQVSYYAISIIVLVALMLIVKKLVMPSLIEQSAVKNL